MAQKLRIGAHLGRYRIERLLARGGMGEVYLADHVRLKRRVALKILAPELAADPGFRERFIRESELAASIEHPHIVPIYEADEIDGVLYIAMRYLEGSDLRGLIQEEGPLELDRVVTILSQVADALDAAHDRGLVHRDVKPANILVTRLGPDREHAFLVDFGLTKSSAPGSSLGASLTKPREFVGTVHYAAPEQITGESPGRGADQYSLACVAFECLTGTKPFPHDQEMAVLWAHVQEPAPLLSRRRSDLPPELDEVMASGMAKAADDRYPTCAAFVQALAGPIEAGEGWSLSRARRTNLPTPASSFVGREQELVQAEALLATTRLLTVTGPGGTGKTRFAIELASRVTPGYPDGVAWVPLAPLVDPKLVIETVAQALGAKDRLEHYIGEKRMLLLLDNLEQVIESARDLSSLLAACPNLKLLVTSRELLRIRGETEFVLPPLIGEEGVRLFCERADAIPSEAIGELCSRLDGLPLAIELAAARRKVLTPEQLVGRLGDRLDLLRGGRDVEARHATLRATMQWSSDLLTEEERSLFARLSVFAGGCSLEAGQKVSDADLLDLESLIDKSLLRIEAGRYTMLETVREFALELLESHPGANELRRRHASFYLDLAEQAAPQLKGSDQVSWLDRLEHEVDNFRAALSWSLGGEDPEIGLRFCILLPRFWLDRDFLPEQRRWTEAAMGRLDDVPTHLRAEVLVASGDNAIFLDEYEKAQIHFERSLSLFRELGDRAGEARVLEGLAGVAQELGELERAKELFERSLEICRETGDESAIRRVLHLLGESVRDLGELEQARVMLEESLALSRKIGDLTHVTATTASLGDVELDAGNFDDAVELFMESLRQARVLRGGRWAAYALAGLSAAEAARGRVDRSVRLWGAVEALERDLGIHIIGYERARYERLVAELAELHPDVREEGRSLTPDQAVEYALGQSTPAEQVR